MDTLTRIASLRERAAAWRKAGETVALIPTRGTLHKGHMSLVAEAQERAARVIVSVFADSTVPWPTTVSGIDPRLGWRRRRVSCVAPRSCTRPPMAMAVCCRPHRAAYCAASSNGSISARGAAPCGCRAIAAMWPLSRPSRRSKP